MSAPEEQPEPKTVTVTLEHPIMFRAEPDMSPRIVIPGARQAEILHLVFTAEGLRHLAAALVGPAIQIPPDGIFKINFSAKRMSAEQLYTLNETLRRGAEEQPS